MQDTATQSPSHPGPSPFRWSAGGWFGAQLGSTVWLIGLGIYLIQADVIFGSAAVIAGAALNVWGITLWKMRDGVSAYQAIQLFLTPLAVVFGVLIIWARANGLLIAYFGAELMPDAFPYWFIGLAPLLMIATYVRERSANAKRGA